MTVHEWIEKQIHPDYAKNWAKFDVWRQASSANLAANVIYTGPTQFAREIGLSPEYDSETNALLNPYRKDGRTNYLFKFPLEATPDYIDRSRLAQDFGVSKIVCQVIAGHIISAPHNKDIQFDGIDLYLKDTDCEGTSWETAEYERAFETCAMGKCYAITYKPEDQNGITYLPKTEIIPREDVIDWHYDNQSGFSYIKYRKTERVIDAEYKRSERELRVVWTRKEYKVYAKNNEGQWVAIQEAPNPLGYIPIRDAWMGAKGESLINELAKTQVNEMNLDSEMRQIIRHQLINLLVGPRGLGEQLKNRGMGVGTVVERESNDAEVEFVGPGTPIIDAFIKYWDKLNSRQEAISKIRDSARSANISGYSKEWDFLDLKPVLTILKDAIEEQSKQILSDVLAWMGYVEPKFSYSIEPKFDIKTVTEIMQLAMSAKAFGVGQTAEKHYAKKLISLGGLDIDETESAKIKNELEKLYSEENEALETEDEKNLETTGDTNNE